MFDDDQSDEQYLKELYNRFRKDVLDNVRSEYYTQDELLDIYDYAQDENDHLVMLHVLLTGARYYQDSDFLDERKAFLLSNISNESARGMLAIHGRRDTPLWRVLEISLDCVDGIDPSEKLDALLTSDMRLDAEAVIWLIDNLHAARRHDLIVENIDKIAEKAEDPAEVYHSAALALYNEGGEYYPYALAWVEELTRIDSFFVDGWILNARIEFQLDHYAEALQAIDYALALDPDNPEAAWVKSMILPMTADNDDIPTIIEQVRKVISYRPDWLPATIALAGQFERAGHRSAMFETLDAFMDRSNSPEDLQEAALTALKADPENRSRYLAVLDRALELGGWYSDDCTREQQWNKVALELVNEGKLLQAEWLFEYYHTKYGLKFFIYNYITVMYRNREYDRVVAFSETAPMIEERMRKILTTDIEALFDRIKGFTYIAGAYLKTGNPEKALSTAGRILSEIPDMNYTVSDTIFVNGLRLQLRFIEYLALHPDFIPADDDFDPLTSQVDLKAFTSGPGEIPFK